MKEIKIFNGESSLEYYSLLNSYNLSLDIYYLPEFLEVEANFSNEGYFEIFCVLESSKVFIYPYLILPIQINGYKEYFDVSSPYGYCGPYLNNDDETFFNYCENKLIQYFSTKKILTEFVRYHYVYNKNIRFNHNIFNEHNRVIFTIPIDHDYDSVKSRSFNKSTKRKINKCLKSGYKTEIVKDKECLNEFIDFYYETMKRASASNFYFFKKEMFFELYSKLKDRLLITRVINDVGVSCCYFLYFRSGKFLTYYLSGRNFSESELPVNFLNIAFMTEWACKNGFKILNLGGGLSDDNESGLYRFKASFTKTKTKFMIGKRIHIQDVYDRIKLNFQHENKSNRLQFYR